MSEKPVPLRELLAPLDDSLVRFSLECWMDVDEMGARLLAVAEVVDGLDPTLLAELREIGSLHSGLLLRIKCALAGER